MRLPRDRFIPLLKMFPEEEEKIAEAALSSFEQAKSSRAGRSVLSLAARCQHRLNGIRLNIFPVFQSNWEHGRK